MKKPTYRRTKKEIEKLKRKGFTFQNIIVEMSKDWTYIWNPKGKKYCRGNKVYLTKNVSHFFL